MMMIMIMMMMIMIMTIIMIFIIIDMFIILKKYAFFSRVSLEVNVLIQYFKTVYKRR
jgi:hypothetical protein